MLLFNCDLFISNTKVIWVFALQIKQNIYTFTVHESNKNELENHGLDTERCVQR